MSEVALKTKRVTKNLGYNTAGTQDESYAAIEAKCPTSRCGRGTHEGERVLPVRMFYLNDGGKTVQGACIACDKEYRANRSVKNRSIYGGKTHQEIYEMYFKNYGKHTMTCSKCKESKNASEFNISIGMECGLHNECIVCTTGNSQGNGDIRDFIFMPDKDGIKYIKKDTCERCGGTDKLAVDHIVPIAKGGSDCIVNKQTLCIHCNSKKSDTIDCPVNSNLVSVRYRYLGFDFTDNISLSRALSRKVYEFTQALITNASIDDIRNSVSAYIKKNNLGHNLERIVGKISIKFNKT